MIENNAGHPPESVWEEIERGLDRDLFNWYKEKTENNGEEPPGQIWENIENQLDNKLYQWYGQGITQNAEEPTEAVWDNIQDELDIDDTWKQISKKLDQKQTKRRNLVIYAAAAALLAFLVLRVFSPLENDLPFSESQQEYVSKQDDADRAGPGKDEVPAADSAAESEEHMADGDIEPSPRERGSRTSEKHEATEEADEEEPAREQQLLARTEQLSIQKVNPAGIQLEVDTDASLMNTSRRMPAASISGEPETTSQRKIDYYMGMTGEVGQSWLLSQKTLYSIQKSPYSSASPNQGQSIGIVGGINLNDRLSLQLEGFIQNESGQRYKEYTDGQVISNQITLDYTSLNLLGRYELFGSNVQVPLSHHAVVGFYGGYLKNARQELDGNSENLRQAYKNYDLGMVLGYELDAQLAPNFIISTGFRLDPGIINIYEGMPNLPADFNKTYSSSVNLNISVKYNLPH